MATDIDIRYKVTYDENVQQLIGQQERSLLQEFVLPADKKGEAAYFDAVGDADAAADTAYTGLSRRSDGVAAHADLTALLTPHMEVANQRTKVLPYKQDWGHMFEEEDQVEMLRDPTNPIVVRGVRAIQAQTDAKILSAFDGDMTRTATGGTEGAVSFLTAQTITSSVVTDGTWFDTDVFANVLELFQGNYGGDEPIFMAIPPAMQRELISNSGGTILSRDFVTPRGFLERGELPDIYGIHVLVLPALTVATGADVTMFAWQKSGMVLNTFAPLTSDLSKSAAFSFRPVAYLRQSKNAARIDDKRVVKIVYDRTA